MSINPTMKAVAGTQQKCPDCGLGRPDVEFYESQGVGFRCKGCMRKYVAKPEGPGSYAVNNPKSRAKCRLAKQLADATDSPFTADEKKLIYKARTKAHRMWQPSSLTERIIQIVEAEYERRHGLELPDKGGIEGNYDEAELRERMAETARQLEEERKARRELEKKVRAGGNVEVGTEREELHVTQERARLEAEGRLDLAVQVRRTHPQAPGYDVVSFVAVDGVYDETHDEVKGPNDNHLSPNEYDVAKHDPRWRQVNIDEKTGKTKVTPFEKHGYFWHPTGAMKRVKLRAVKQPVMLQVAAD